MPGPKVTPPPEPPPGFDPDDRSWHGYKRTWQSDTIWVDLKPVENMLREKARDFTRFSTAQDARGNKPNKGLSPRKINNAVGLCGEAAVAMLLGGRTMGKGKGGDVRLRSGRVLEVKTRYKGYPFRRFPPSASANNAYFPEADLVMCVCTGYPECYERIGVVGWLPREDLYEHREQRKGGDGFPYWSFPWKDGVWHSIAEIMQDELADPVLSIGMPGRRHVEDCGLPQYLSYYISGRSVESLTGPDEAEDPEVAGSARTEGPGHRGTGSSNLTPGRSLTLHPDELN